jgi:hypothetical protein
VLSQDYPNLEYIVMDGGSTDNSKEVIEKYAKDLSYWQSKPDKGQYFAIEDGFNRGTGEIMAWLNSDDKYHPGALWRVADVFTACKYVHWITGRPTAWSSSGQMLWVSKDLPVWTLESLQREQGRELFPQQESTFWRGSLWKEAGAYLATDLKLAADFELWIRFFRFAQLYTVDALLGGYREHGDQKGHTQKKEYIDEVHAVVEREKKVPTSPRHIEATQPIVISLEAIATMANDIQGAESSESDAQKLIKSLTELVGTQFEQLREKEEEVRRLKLALDERLKALEAASISLVEKEDEIKMTQKAAMERARALVEKEEMIRSLHSVAEERSRVLELVNEELERIKRHWAYRTAVRMKRLLEKVSGKRSP